MTIRKIRIKTVQNNVWTTIETAATTFGELQKEVPQISFTGKRTVVRENRTTLELKDAKLPDGDFTVYVMNEKTKAGATDAFGNTLTAEDINTMSFQDLRRASSANNLPANGISAETMRAELLALVNASSGSLKNEIISDLQKVIEKIESMDEATDTEYLKILEEDLKKIQQELNV